MNKSQFFFYFLTYPILLLHWWNVSALFKRCICCSSYWKMRLSTNQLELALYFYEFILCSLLLPGLLCCSLAGSDTDSPHARPASRPLRPPLGSCSGGVCGRCIWKHFPNGYVIFRTGCSGVRGQFGLWSHSTKKAPPPSLNKQSWSVNRYHSGGEKQFPFSSLTPHPSLFKNVPSLPAPLPCGPTEGPFSCCFLSLNAGRRCSRDFAGCVCITRQTAARQTFKSVTLALRRGVDSKRLKL